MPSSLQSSAVGLKPAVTVKSTNKKSLLVCDPGRMYVPGGARFSGVRYHSRLGKHTANQRDRQSSTSSLGKTTPQQQYHRVFSREASSNAKMRLAAAGRRRGLLREAARERRCRNSELRCCLLSNSGVRHTDRVFTRVHLFCFQWDISGVKGYT